MSLADDIREVKSCMEEGRESLHLKKLETTRKCMRKVIPTMLLPGYFKAAWHLSHFDIHPLGTLWHTLNWSCLQAKHKLQGYKKASYFVNLKIKLPLCCKLSLS